MFFRSASRKSLSTSGSVNLHQLAVGEPERAHVEGVALAVLGEPGADDPIAPAAIVGGIVVDAAQRRRRADAPPAPGPGAPTARSASAKVQCTIAGGDSVTRVAIRQHHRLEPHRVVDAAFAGPDQRRHRRRNRQIGGEPQPAGGRGRRLLDVGHVRGLRGRSLRRPRPWQRHGLRGRRDVAKDRKDDER